MIVFFFSGSVASRGSHSFPTRRSSDLIGEPAAFLQDGMDVVMELYNERPISVQLPDQIEATIVEADAVVKRSEEHTSELQSRPHLVCRLLLEKKNTHD